MSQWTHVNGSIRVDALRAIGNMDFDSIFKTCSFEDKEEKWDECNVPCGSEGSLYVNVWHNPSGSSIAAYTVNFFGDLRDFDSAEAVLTWFKRIIKECGMIRDGVMTVEVASKSYSVYRVFFDEDDSNNRYKVERVFYKPWGEEVFGEE